MKKLNEAYPRWLMIKSAHKLSKSHWLDKFVHYVHKFSPNIQGETIDWAHASDLRKQGLHYVEAAKHYIEHHAKNGKNVIKKAPFSEGLKLDTLAKTTLRAQWMNKFERWMKREAPGHNIQWDKVHDYLRAGHKPREAAKQYVMDHVPKNEEAPPGDKYERMVKHIKAGRHDKKSMEIAYATAWKAYNKKHHKEETELEKLGKEESSLERFRKKHKWKIRAAIAAGALGAAALGAYDVAHPRLGEAFPDNNKKKPQQQPKVDQEKESPSAKQDVPDNKEDEKKAAFAAGKKKSNDDTQQQPGENEKNQEQQDQAENGSGDSKFPQKEQENGQNDGKDSENKKLSFGAQKVKDIYTKSRKGKSQEGKPEGESETSDEPSGKGEKTIFYPTMDNISTNANGI